MRGLTRTSGGRLAAAARRARPLSRARRRTAKSLTRGFRNVLHAALMSVLTTLRAVLSRTAGCGPAAERRSAGNVVPCCVLCAVLRTHAALERGCACVRALRGYVNTSSLPCVRSSSCMRSTAACAVGRQVRHLYAITAREPRRHDTVSAKRQHHLTHSSFRVAAGRPDPRP